MIRYFWRLTLTQGTILVIVFLLGFGVITTIWGGPALSREAMQALPGIVFGLILFEILLRKALAELERAHLGTEPTTAMRLLFQTFVGVPVLAIAIAVMSLKP
jgi:hypothetical protein